MKPSLKNWRFKNRRSGNNNCNTALSFTGKSCIFYLMMLPHLLFSQNLVLNPSFESYTTCPNGTYGYGINYVNSWTGAGTSVDYFNACANPSPYFAIPTMFFSGFQHARTGNAFVGFSIYHPSNLPTTREYLQTQLTDSLVAGKCYRLSFYVNLCNLCAWASNSTAANFSTTTFTDSLEQLTPLTPHIFKFNNPIITDTSNWIEINGIYTATGGEKYLTIGDFYDNANTDTLGINASGSINGGYYFVDDVSVIPIDSIPGGIPANAGNDITIGLGDSVFIGQEMYNLNCNWYIGTTLIADSISGIKVSPATTTTYTVEQNLCGTITYDTVTVFVSLTGITENTEQEPINLFPNPNTGEFNLEFKNKGDYTINVTTITGMLVYSGNLTASNGMSNFRLDISNGVYFVHITNTSNRESIVKKLVIRK